MISVIVVCYNMRREAPRTLSTLAAQTNVLPEDYEVIAIDNGSGSPLDPRDVQACGNNFRYVFLDTDSVSPAGAVNHGVALARGTEVAIVVDGARMLSPGIVAETIKALGAHQRACVCALAFHLGPDVQKISMQQGYDQKREDELLASVAWRDDGYALFDISCLAPSSANGFGNGLPTEASWIAMPRAIFEAIGGFDERFASPGGGLVNQHFLNRALRHPGVAPVVLVGEGTFHQFHGGVATNAPPDRRPDQLYHEEYRAIAGTAYEKPRVDKVFYQGSLGPAAERFVLAGPADVAAAPTGSDRHTLA